MPQMDFRAEMVKQLNIARQNPRSLIADVSAGDFQPESKTETIAFLSSARPCANTMVENSALDALAQDYATTQGNTGNTGHDDLTARTASVVQQLSPIGENISYGYTHPYVEGATIPAGSYRVIGYNPTLTTYTTRNGVTTTSTSQGGTTLQYYTMSPREVVIALIVDEGVPSKGHRDNIYNCNYNQVGIGIAPHKSYRVEVTNLYGRSK